MLKIRTIIRWTKYPKAMINATDGPKLDMKVVIELVLDGGFMLNAAATMLWNETRPPMNTLIPANRITTPSTARSVPATTSSSGLPWRISPTRAMIPIRIGTWLKMLLAIH